jgi:hypothetical protein
MRRMTANTTLSLRIHRASVTDANVGPDAINTSVVASRVAGSRHCGPNPALARSAIAPYVRRIPDRPRLNFPFQRGQRAAFVPS